jgi:hypothetical protein
MGDDIAVACSKEFSVIRCKIRRWNIGGRKIRRCKIRWCRIRRRKVGRCKVRRWRIRRRKFRIIGGEVNERVGAPFNVFERRRGLCGGGTSVAFLEGFLGDDHVGKSNMTSTDE